MYTLLWGGGALGPLLAGFVQEATNDLRLALIITSIGGLALTATGLMLSIKGREPLETRLTPVPGPR